MRTTLDIDSDVLERVRELAAERRASLGHVLSDLARIALAPRADSKSDRNGVPLLPKNPGARLVTLDIVNRLR